MPPAVCVLTIILVIILLNIVTSTVKVPEKPAVDGVAVIPVCVVSDVTPVISVGYVIVPANVSCVLPTGTDLPGIPFLSIVITSLAVYPAPASVTIILDTLLLLITNLLVNLVVPVPPDTLAASIIRAVSFVAVFNCFVILANVFGIEAAVKMLWYKVNKEHWPVIKPMLIYLNYITEKEKMDVPLDPLIIERLRKI